MVLLQYTPVVPATFKNPIAGEFDFPGLFNVGVLVAKQVQTVCIPVIGIALMIKFFIFLTKVFNERQVDYASFGQFLLLMFFLYEYAEVMSQVNNLMSYFTDNITKIFDKYGSGHTVVDKINEVYDSYSKNSPDVSLFSSMSNIWDWIIGNCTHMIIIITRGITMMVRSLFLVFMFAVGPLAILFSMFPGFEGNLKIWLKWYISVAFWTVTLAILDLILFKYLDYCQANNTLDGITTINIGLALMYLLVPMLTTMYINSQSGHLLSKMTQVATATFAMSRLMSKSSTPGLNHLANQGLSSVNKVSGGNADDSLGKTAGRAAGNIYRKVAPIIRQNF